MASDNLVEKGIYDIVGALYDPIIVYPGGWGETMPDWLKTAVTLERLAMNMKAFQGEEMTGTDAEACAYLMAASLSYPMTEDWAQIYLYVAGITMRRWNKSELPAAITVKTLTEKQTLEMNRFKKWIYMTRTRAQKNEQVESIADTDTLQAKFF